MSLYTERHGMRTPIERTYLISIKTYSRLFDCCSRYFEYLAWKYPVECPDGNGCCGLDFKKFSGDMEFEIPTLFRREGRIDKPQSIQFPFDDEPIDDEFDQYALIDLIEFVAQNIRDITQKRYHDFFRHNDLFFGGTNEIAEKFIEEINNTFQKAGLLYQLTTNLEVERIEETAILSEKIEKDIQAIKEPGLRELLIVAVQKHKSPYPDDQKDAVEKIWDAFERLKTYYIDKKKNESADQIISDMSEGKEAYIKLFTA